MNKRIRKKNMEYPKEIIKNASRINTHLRLYPILGDLPNDGMSRLNMIRSLRRAGSYTWYCKKHRSHININIKIQMSSEYGGSPNELDPYNPLFKRPITMLELFVKRRKLRKEKIINLKRKHRTYAINS